MKPFLILLLKVSGQWHDISFLGDNFSTVSRGRKLYAIVLFYVGLTYVDCCCLVLACGKKSLLPVLYIILVCYS